MLKALALQICKGCGSFPAAAAALEGSAAMRTFTTGSWRGYSSNDSTSSSTERDGGAPANSSSSSSTARSSQTKEWRSWIDTKLDSNLEAVVEQEVQEVANEAQPAVSASAAPDAPASAAEQLSQRAEAIAAALQAAADVPEAAAASAPPRPRGPQPASQPRSKGFELEQQIYNIIAPTRPAEDAALPEGVSNYGQLAMASDAPRFERSASNIEDLSPQRLHPTRLFFPNTLYTPAELNPYNSAETALDPNKPPPPPLNPDEVTRLADFKNAPMLALYQSDTGKLPLRQHTQLRAKLHRHLARQIKIARIMGILSPTERWQQPVQDNPQRLHNSQRPQRTRTYTPGSSRLS